METWLDFVISPPTRGKMCSASNGIRIPPCLSLAKRLVVGTLYLYLMSKTGRIIVEKDPNF